MAEFRSTPEQESALEQHVAAELEAAWIPQIQEVVDSHGGQSQEVIEQELRRRWRETFSSEMQDEHAEEQARRIAGA